MINYVRNDFFLLVIAGPENLVQKFSSNESYRRMFELSFSPSRALKCSKFDFRRNFENDEKYIGFRGKKHVPNKKFFRNS